MKNQTLARLMIAGVLLQTAPWVRAADWPQFMRSSEHTGDAAKEELRLPLGLTTAVQLDDMVTTSPAVVSGRVYVVDQMGTAYCIDPRANRIVWKNNPDGQSACGGNTSSPCVAIGRVFFGTTAGRFHVLDAANGNVIKSMDAGWPITGAPTLANERVYFQTLGAIVHCLDLDGKERWRWNHYKQFTDPRAKKPTNEFPGSYQDPHYGGGEIAVTGKKIVVPLGWDIFCIEDEGDAPKLAWCNRAVLGKDAGIPMSPAISGEWIYFGMPSTDQMGGSMRVKLADGAFDPKTDFRNTSYPGFNWATFANSAVRGNIAYHATHYMGVHATQFGPNKSIWHARSDNSLDQRKFTGAITSPALSRDHCVFGTVFGELHVVALNSSGSWPDFKPKPFTFKTPFGKMIGSSPVIVDGAVYFGCDDGYLYGLAPDGKLETPTKMSPLEEPRSRPTAATGKRYGAPVASMDQGNRNFVDDASLKPPFRLRWAMKPFDLRVQMSADDDSLYFISEAGTLASIEQATGRIRWRRRLNSPVDGWEQMLLDQGRLFITRNAGKLDRKPGAGGAELLSVEAKNGRTRWETTWGSIQGTCRTSPVLVGNVVAGFTVEGSPPRPVAKAFDADTGKPLWSHDMHGDAKTRAGGACVLDGMMIFSCGHTWGNGAGATIAVEPKSGKIQWSVTDNHVHGYGRPAAHNGRVYLGGQSGAPMWCLNAKTGKPIWEQKVSYSHHPALGDEWFVTRGYGGSGMLRELATGKIVVKDGKEMPGGCPDHACSPVLLSSAKLSFAVSSSGLYVRDLSTGKILWQSLGFAPRACTSPIAANGRLFFSPNVNNMLYCFEPMPEK